MSSLSRRSGDATAVTSSLHDPEVSRSLRAVTKPPSMKRTLRTVGVALIITPDPFTTAIGAAMVGASFATRNEPASLGTLAKETCECFSGLGSIARDLESLSI